MANRFSKMEWCGVRNARAHGKTIASANCNALSLLLQICDAARRARGTIHGQNRQLVVFPDIFLVCLMRPGGI
jgi:hypothetical protein